MKTYKDYQKWNIGSSDIASLLLLGCNENGAEPMLLTFGSDGDYSAYIIPDNVDIGEHYKKVAEYTDWLKIYDDYGRTAEERNQNDKREKNHSEVVRQRL